MGVKSTLWILFFISVQEAFIQGEVYYDEYEYTEPVPVNCPTTQSIRGGHVNYTQGGLVGSVLTYHCGVGRYPFPVRNRICGADGNWSPMRIANRRLVSQATCKDVLCPAQLQLDHGDFWPRDQWFRVGTTQTFSCQGGFTLYGSTQRNCTVSGDWTGTTPICENHADDCNDPGIPPGAQRSAGRFQKGDKVSYRCQTGLILLGSAEQVCLEGREWSGAAPRCQGQNTFDSPSDVATAMAGSLAGALDMFTPDSKKRVTFARTFNVAEGSRMNVYILLDTSGSIERQDFEKSRNATIALIRKLDSYEVQMRFHVLSFASTVQDIVDITDTETSGDSEQVIWRLMDFDYNSHGRKTGTNIYAALHRVSEMISFLKQNSHRNHFNETQNIIIIQTDGFTNTGKKPQIALLQIRQLLGYSNPLTHDHTDETKLDVYVFGIGDQVNKDELNSLASNKRNEKHIFILDSYKTLGEVFNSIISDQSVTMCGVAQEDVLKLSLHAYTRPWHINIPAVSCGGSIVSQNWVLTAAHCFSRANTVVQKVDVLYGGGKMSSKRVILHPKFNMKALKHRNVSEFYDYDVALVEMSESIPLSQQARPICMPCTIPASRAMKKINSTCQQHRMELLPHMVTAASFIHKNSDRRETHVHLESQRPSCVEKARQTLTEPTDVTLDEYVPRRFLCSGGTSAYRDSVTCKGDSGGSLFLEKRKRYFQVGVVSWGTINVCDPHRSDVQRYSSDNPPPDARDFHIDLFEIMPWLKEHLGSEIQFLPEVN